LYFVEMIYVCGKPRDCFICCCVLYFVEMIYVCGKLRGSFICFCLLLRWYMLTKYKRQKQMKQPLGFPQTYIISTKYKNKWRNPFVSHKHIQSQQNTKDKNKRNNSCVFHKHFVEMIYVCGKLRGSFICFCLLLRWYMFVGNPGVVVFCILLRWYMFVENATTTNETIPRFPTNIYHLNKIQKTKTNETTPGFPTNLYHLNKIQKQMKEPLCFSQTYTRRSFICCCVLYFVEMIYVCGKPRDSFICFCILLRWYIFVENPGIKRQK
jgi:hypothetical protein